MRLPHSTAKSKLDVLLLEDDPSDAMLVERLLHKDGLHELSVKQCSRVAEATRILKQQSFDLILTDISLPDSDGVDTVEALVAANRTTPIIALTTYDDDELGLSIIRAGASDYLAKDQLSKTVLFKSISYSIERFRFIGIEETNQLLESKNERLADLYKISQQFVDNVSHEFRTPLTVIREFASIIRDQIDGPINEQQRKRLDGMINRTDDLSSMVDDLLDTSQLESGLISTCRCEHDLSDIIRQVVRMLGSRAKAKRIKIVADFDSVDHTIFCDEEKLRRVLINLLVNAIKFTQSEGEVRVFARQFDQHQIEIVVVDNGPGIAEDDLKVIFDRFQKVGHQKRLSSCKGFGLGLSIARSLASLNLGELRVHSEHGVGSQFSVLVPVFEMESVLSSYFKQRALDPVDGGDVSLSQVTIDSEDAIELEAADEFLRSSVKCYDLTLQVAKDRWLVFSCSERSDTAKMHQRLAEVWDEERTDTLSTLPDFKFEYRMTASLPEQQAELLASFFDLAAAPNPAQAEQRTDSNAGTKHILIIEDEAELASALETRLTAVGDYRVSQAVDGISGIEMASSDKPDVIILDIRMPQLDGLEVLKRLSEQERTANIPVIVVSGSLSDKKLALSAGASCFLQKPYKSDLVQSVIIRVLDQSRTPVPRPPMTGTVSYCPPPQLQD